ncbi:MAG: hypothetical protein KAG89_14925 [Fulvimarina manganoxydans]|uniref:DUF1254 domain-containing protein n=1 Tax=Fulvimarina manganoxydans TaxID=937218 RepID=UPI002353A5EC|nr:hypothetical protein [Fulvimarina manganoxydans]MCK5933452.1 hypothetical protein [Fulvimarina manganoxydans]
MGRIILTLLVGLVGAGLVHIATVFMVPRVAENNAWGRLSALGAPYEVVRIAPLRDTSGQPSAPRQAARNAFSFVDPAFVVAGCRFSLEDGPVEIAASGVLDGFWSASIYDRKGDNLYSINDRAAIEGVVDLVVGTREQIEAIDAMAPFTSEETSLPVILDVGEGYMTLRILIDEESKRPAVDNFLRTVTCAPLDAVGTASTRTSQAGIVER